MMAVKAVILLLAVPVAHASRIARSSSSAPEVLAPEPSFLETMEKSFERALEKGSTLVKSLSFGAVPAFAAPPLPAGAQLSFVNSGMWGRDALVAPGGHRASSSTAGPALARMGGAKNVSGYFPQK
ncbi:unnamed protein product [Prorocentrum cordatum]|uniref:Uncharacterized protein n=1 Tax=Prorocentrum cordatum TaxID=2364126 RepID=A0ABN9XHI9_9DINO|nr:unnamed protein product [Polarella glacialis]